MAQDLLKRTLEGAAAGAAGTVALQALMLPAEMYLPNLHPPQNEDPATFMLWQAERHLPRRTWLKIPRKAETVAGFALSFGYGMSFGLLYAAMRRRKPSVLLDGATLGLVCWAAGYLGWLPATKLIPPPWKQTPSQIAGPVIEHVVYGIATVAAYEFLRGKW